MDNATLIGLAAGTLTTISFLPQVIKTWKSKSTKDISIGMYAALSVGLLLWIFYGLSIDSMPVIITNTVSLILTVLVLLLKIKYGWQNNYIHLLTNSLIMLTRTLKIFWRGKSTEGYTLMKLSFVISQLFRPIGWLYQPCEFLDIGCGGLYRFNFINLTSWQKRSKLKLEDTPSKWWSCSSLSQQKGYDS